MPRHSAPKQPAWLRPRLVVAFVVAATGLTIAVWLPTRNDSADAAERSRNVGNVDSYRERNPAQTSFADDFTGPRGSTVDPAKWSLTTNRADNGLEFRESTRNARLDGDGNLAIVLRAEDRDGFSSARLLTRDTLRAATGHVEARIKAPEGDGVRPAFELVGAGRQGFGSFAVLTEPLSDGFHTYAVDWAPGEVVLSVDGEQINRFTPQGLDGDQPFRLALSLAVTDDRSDATFPARMLVDSVSFAADGATPPASPSATPPTSEPTTPPTTVEPTSPPTTPTNSPPAETTPPTTPPTSAPAATQWTPFTDYIAGQLVTYKGVEYQVLETHTSLPGWEPTALPNLFRKL